MPSLYKNETGAALIVVLLIITVIAIITPPVVSNILSSAEQYQRTEESVQRTKLIDMGLIYMENAMIESEEVASSETESWLANLNSLPTHTAIIHQFRDSFTNDLDRLDGIEISITNQVRYRITLSDIKIENGQDILVFYTITPTVNGDYDENHQVEELKTIQLDIEGSAP